LPNNIRPPTLGTFRLTGQSFHIFIFRSVLFFHFRELLRPNLLHATQYEMHSMAVYTGRLNRKCNFNRQVKQAPPASRTFVILWKGMWGYKIYNVAAPFTVLELFRVKVCERKPQPKSDCYQVQNAQKFPPLKKKGRGPPKKLLLTQATWPYVAIIIRIWHDSGSSCFWEIKCYR